jgi:hypothetical protein
MLIYYIINFKLYQAFTAICARNPMTPILQVISINSIRLILLIVSSQRSAHIRLHVYLNVNSILSTRSCANDVVFAIVITTVLRGLVRISSMRSSKISSHLYKTVINSISYSFIHIYAQGHRDRF